MDEDTDVLSRQLEDIEAELAATPDVTGQLKLGLDDDDAAAHRLTVAQQLSAHMGRPRGSVNKISEAMKQDVHRAWVALGGARFLVSCMASKDTELRGFAMRIFETMFKGSAQAEAMMLRMRDARTGQEQEFTSFVMKLDNDAVQQTKQQAAQRVSEH